MIYQEYVGHIMWQPTANCTMGCKDCYVAKSNSTEVNVQTILDIYFHQTITCNQFTISADNLLSFPKALHDALRCVWKLYPDTSLPELCVTANSWNTVLCWAREMNMNVDQFLKPITILSLSNFPPLGKNVGEMIEQCHTNNTKVNFNYMVKGGEEDSKYFDMGCRYADQVYLVYKKAPLGEEQCAESFSNWLKARKIGKEIAPNKIIEDQCIMDALHYIHTGHKCGAGKKKAQVWPNGKLTGCPDDSNQTCGDMGTCKICEVVRGTN